MLNIISQWGGGILDAAAKRGSCWLLCVQCAAAWLEFMPTGVGFFLNVGVQPFGSIVIYAKMFRELGNFFAFGVWERGGNRL